MICLYPKDIKGRGTVPCGKCLACVKRRQDDWVIRLTNENDHATSSFFITLTYRDGTVPYALHQVGDSYEKVNVLRKRDVQLWMKRLRKLIEPAKIRFFACGEYGTKTFRPHYHVILFNYPSDRDIWKDIPSTWSLGFVTIALVKPARIQYVAKYCACKQFLPSVLLSKPYRPFVLCSRRPAIGAQFLSDARLDYHRSTLKTMFTDSSGLKRPLPKYYKDRIFDDDMRATIKESTSEYIQSQLVKFHDKWQEDVTSYRLSQVDDAERVLRDKLFKNKSKIDSL